MKRTLILSLITLISAGLSAQIQDPVHWQFSVTGTGTQYELHLKAAIDGGWHIYAQVQPEEAIAIPTQITFNKNPMITIKGATQEVGKKEKDENKELGIIQYQFEEKVDFVQTVALKAKVKTKVTGTVTYQVCTNQMCLPPKTIPFTISL